jgi:hypothetical protein
LFELYRWLRRQWIQHILEQKKKGKAAPKTSGNATQKRAGLPILDVGKGQPDKNQAGNAGSVERTERTGRAAKGSLNRRVFLFE